MPASCAAPTRFSIFVKPTSPALSPIYRGRCVLCTVCKYIPVYLLDKSFRVIENIRLA